MMMMMALDASVFSFQLLHTSKTMAVSAPTCSHQKHLNVIRQALANLRDKDTNLCGYRCDRSTIDEQLIALITSDFQPDELRRVDDTGCRCRTEQTVSEAETGNSSPLATRLRGSSTGEEEEDARLKRLKVRMTTRCVRAWQSVVATLMAVELEYVFFFIL